MNRTAIFAATATGIVCSMFAWWANGLSRFSILLIVAFTVLVYLLTTLNLQGKAPGTKGLKIGPIGWAVSIFIALALLVAIFTARWTAARAQKVIAPPATINNSILEFSKKIPRVQELTLAQKQEIANLVPATMSYSASEAECEAAQDALLVAERRMADLGLANQQATLLAVASVPRPNRNVPWQELFKAHIQRHTLEADQQIRQAANGLLPYVIEEVGSEASLDINPSMGTGPWYVGLPLCGITGEDRGRQGLQGHFKSVVTNVFGQSSHFEVSDAPHAVNDPWWDLKNDALCFTDPDGDVQGVWVRWKKGEKAPNSTFKVTSSYVTNEWPVSWRMRIHHLPPGKRVPVTDVPTEVNGLIRSRVDSLVIILITNTDGTPLEKVQGEVWFGNTSKLLNQPLTPLSTVGKDNPALGIENLNAQDVNIDLVFLPRTNSDL